jgi:hypothetical protein
MKIWIFEITLEEIKTATEWICKLCGKISVPKNRAGNIGIIVALKTEGDEERNRLRNDYIHELRAYLQSSKIGQEFEVIEFPPTIANRIGGASDAKLFAEKAKAHMIIFGSLVKRKDKGNLCYVFRLHGLVRHANIRKEISDKLGREFGQFLPGRVNFREEDELLGFELTEQWTGFTVKYICGIAAGLSMSFGIAYNLFDELHRELSHRESNDQPPIVVEMRKRLPIRIQEAGSAILTQNYLMFAKTRERQHILDSRPVADRILDVAPEDYRARLQRAICQFFADDIDAAIDDLREIKSRDATWRYSLGFLLAFKGDINGALEQYQKTFHSHVPDNVLNDTEIFISEVVDAHPERVQLIFFRGIVNYKGKGDLALAEQDFSTFLAKDSSNAYPKLEELAENYLTKIRMGITND